MTLKMRQAAPTLDLPLAGGGRFKLGAAPPTNFSLLIFYRGLHCQRCEGYLGEFETRLSKFDQLGVDVVAISSDTQERAEKSKAAWRLPNLKIGYALDVDEGRSWGLFVSRGIRADEPAIFTEPGLFLVDRQGLLVLAVINSITRMRPAPQDVVETIERVLERSRLGERRYLIGVRARVQRPRGLFDLLAPVLGIALGQQKQMAALWAFWLQGKPSVTGNGRASG